MHTYDYIHHCIFIISKRLCVCKHKDHMTCRCAVELPVVHIAEQATFKHDLSHRFKTTAL